MDPMNLASAWKDLESGLHLSREAMPLAKTLFVFGAVAALTILRNISEHTGEAEHILAEAFQDEIRTWCRESLARLYHEDAQ